MIQMTICPTCKSRVKSWSRRSHSGSRGGLKEQHGRQRMPHQVTRHATGHRAVKHTS